MSKFTIAALVAVLACPALSNAESLSKTKAPTKLKIDAKPSWFTVGSVDLGYKFIRPRIQVGYGLARNQWVGFESNPVVTSRALGAYAGLRVRNGWAELRMGTRIIRSNDHSFLPKRDSYTREFAELIVDNRKASYSSHRVVGKLRLPVLGGFVQPEVEGVFFQGVPSDRYLFAELFGVVTGGRMLVRTRLSYFYSVVSVPSLRVGVAIENIFLPRRNADIWRAGPIAQFAAFDNLSFRFSLLPSVLSPDPLGLIGSEFEFGIRWYWLEQSQAR